MVVWDQNLEGANETYFRVYGFLNAELPTNGNLSERDWTGGARWVHRELPPWVRP